MQKNITSLGSLNWDDLKFFLEVARTRKASVAAKRLAVDYTTVSRRISSLEVSLGTLLFEKSRTNGFVLTPEGQRLLGYAESIEAPCTWPANRCPAPAWRCPAMCVWAAPKASAASSSPRS
jgi:hypothetical protein